MRHRIQIAMSAGAAASWSSLHGRRCLHVMPASFTCVQRACVLLGLFKRVQRGVQVAVHLLAGGEPRRAQRQQCWCRQHMQWLFGRDICGVQGRGSLSRPLLPDLLHVLRPLPRRLLLRPVDCLDFHLATSLPLPGRICCPSLARAPTEGTKHEESEQQQTAAGQWWRRRQWQQSGRGSGLLASGAAAQAASFKILQRSSR